MTTYRELDALPEYVDAIWDGEKLVNRDAPTRWSGKVPPPAIGEKVFVAFNDLGAGIVQRYFVEEGWLGLLVKFENPPEWYTRQHMGNPPGHVFGAELRSPK